MDKIDRVDARYRVFLIGIEDPTEERKRSFCRNISEKYDIPLPLLEKIVERYPIVFKKNLTLKRAMTLAKILKSYGARVSVEEKKGSTPVFLEFQKREVEQVALESSHLRRSQNGAWNVIGRVRNISAEDLNDTWVLVQLFDDRDELLTFEEVPTSINPLPPGEASPFKVVFEGDLPIQKTSITFKNSSGTSLSSVDRREKQDWVEVNMDDDEEVLTIDVVERSRDIKIAVPVDERVSDLGISLPSAEEGEPMAEESREEIPEEPPGVLLRSDSIEIDSKIFEENGTASTMTEEKETPGARGLELSLESEVFQQRGLDEGTGGERTERGPFLTESGHLPETQEMILQEAPSDTFLDKLTASPGEIPEKTPEKPSPQTLSSFPWIEDFRNSIESYYQENPNPFFKWFESCRKNGHFKNSLQALLTILVQARFDQMNDPESALGNTQKVFTLDLQGSLSLEGIPSLEGTPFFSAEQWRELFHRALPRLQQISRNMMEKRRWDAFELERLIQVIPHMSNKTSRRTVRWIHDLVPDLAEVSFSDTPISIDQNLYRVASRLGVVDPHVDYCDSGTSIGNLKIQAFGKEAFPQYPLKIDEPMVRMGMNGEGGHCLSIQPECEGCLFEGFCQRFYLDFDPSEKGLVGK